MNSKKRAWNAFKKKIKGWNAQAHFSCFGPIQTDTIHHILNVNAYQHNLPLEFFYFYFLFLKLIKYQVKIYQKILPTKKKDIYPKISQQSSTAEKAVSFLAHAACKGRNHWMLMWALLIKHGSLVPTSPTTITGLWDLLFIFSNQHPNQTFLFLFFIFKDKMGK